MGRYIDAETFAERMLEQWYTADEEKKAEIVAVLSNIVTPILVSIPTAEVQPVRHGEWIEQEEPYVNTYECSNCKRWFVLEDGTPKENDYNYCPNCGANMRGAKNDKQRIYSKSLNG